MSDGRLRAEVEREVARVKSHLARYYRKLDHTPPGEN